MFDISDNSLFSICHVPLFCNKQTNHEIVMPCQEHDGFCYLQITGTLHVIFTVLLGDLRKALKAHAA